MNWNGTAERILGVVLFSLLAAVLADAGSIKGRVSIAGKRGTMRTEQAGTVVWLTPLPQQSGLPMVNTKLSPAHVSLIQKNKRFDPRVLVVEVGRTVNFPNKDPFFHNVFSMFEGKRFDLGLYEAGSTRSVRFDRPGVCYIFCNIHSQMSAVVIAVDSPYFAVSDASGNFEIPSVPPGRYQLNVWAERCLPKTLKELSREVTVGESGSVLGTIHLQESRETVHLNKYGKSYDPEVFSSPIYTSP